MVGTRCPPRVGAKILNKDFFVFGIVKIPILQQGFNEFHDCDDLVFRQKFTPGRHCRTLESILYGFNQVRCHGEFTGIRCANLECSLDEVSGPGEQAIRRGAITGPFNPVAPDASFKIDLFTLFQQVLLDPVRNCGKHRSWNRDQRHSQKRKDQAFDIVIVHSHCHFHMFRF